MNTPMSRQEFLKYMGIMLLSLVGVGNVISALLHGHSKATETTNPLKKSGFGGGKYGV